MAKRSWIGVFVCTFAAALWGVYRVPITASAQGSLSWPQWAQNPQHTGFLNVKGQNLKRILANIINGIGSERIAPPQFLPPDGTLDAHTLTVSPLTADSVGNIYYNVLKIQDTGNFYGMDAVNSWLVKVAPDDTIAMVSYTGLNPAAPKSTDLCLGIFSSSQLPWPPSTDAVPPSVPCGLQRVGLNIAPAIAPDGTIYTLTRGHFLIGARHSFLLAINPNLTLKWATSLRNRFHDGWGVSPAAG